MKKKRNRLALLVALAGLTIAMVPAGSRQVDRPSEQYYAETLVVPIDSTKTDPESGLVLDDQFMLVKSQCTACHSSKLILQSHFSRDKWIERIRWMQRTQKLWDLGESEPAIVTYLARHYGPIERAFDGRREPLNTVKWHKLSN
jgi:hypothetical protein